MTIRVLITLTIKIEKRNNAYQLLNETNSMKVKKNRDDDSQLVCITEVNNNQTASDIFSIFSNILNIDGLEKIQLFTESKEENIEEEKIVFVDRFVPFIPMIVTSAATFFVIYNVLITLEKNSLEDILHIAGIPTTITFLLQLGTITKSKWLFILKKIKKY